MIKFKEQMEIAKAKIQAAQDEALKLVKNEFQAAAVPIFEQDSRLESFGWRQYTDYFNDGDTCEFSAHIDKDQLVVNGENLDEGEGEIAKTWRETIWGKVDGKYGYTPNPDYSPASEQTINMISDFLGGIGEDSLKLAFGDHAKITVFKDRVEVEEYPDHD